MADPDLDPVLDADPPVDALAIRRPDTPITISDLAALKGASGDVIAARVQIISTLRAASIRATYPEDWVLFRAPAEHGGQTVAYLQDGGGDRVRDLWGIEIFDVSRPEKIALDGGAFLYVITGSGRCKLTGQTVIDVEGGRASTDDFCKGKTGAELELTVRKAARANLDGNITRTLAAVQSVPLDDLKTNWIGTTKRVEQCRLGRGFGSRSERLGATSERAPDVEPPVCPHCKTPGVYRPAKGDRPGFYGCPNYAKHSDRKFIVNADEWVAKSATKAAAAPAAEPVPAADIFKNEIEP